MSLSGQAVSLGRGRAADKAALGEDSSVSMVKIAPASRVGAKEVPDDDQRAVHPFMCTMARWATRGIGEDFRHAMGLASGPAPGLTGACQHPYGQPDAARGVL
jgi:hypothetical protein